MFEENREAVMAIETAYSVRATNANSPISVPRAMTMTARKTLLMPSNAGIAVSFNANFH